MTTPVTIRQTEEEEQYLSDHGYTPSEYWHNSIKRDRNLENKNTKHNNLSKYSNAFFLILFGGFLLIISFSLGNALQMLIVALMGFFMMLYGFFGLLLGWSKSKNEVRDG